jgi:hypothetical protein
MTQPDTPHLDAETWVRTWQAAAPRLAAIRARELEHVDVAAFIRSMADAFDASMRGAEPRLTSGLVEQQRLFRKLVR